MWSVNGTSTRAASFNHPSLMLTETSLRPSSTRESVHQSRSGSTGWSGDRPRWWAPNRTANNLFQRRPSKVVFKEVSRCVECPVAQIGEAHRPRVEPPAPAFGHSSQESDPEPVGLEQTVQARA